MAEKTKAVKKNTSNVRKKGKHNKRQKPKSSKKLR